ncbi:DinB family protein [Bacillus sp. ISL-47]|uniref:DinB family protein n=1 Tax=Bacillus sp. ISL-47 TaxID=2819130 RepID=UPI001BECF894|nr:DinB family protein [Bacillus sp. ISL-47]MBT2691065.1 DinB family protein [Bacillus sp. ISL-47]MBT2707571.1 DinB family protein [Pseudomonas sp. ISL-84]
MTSKAIFLKQMSACLDQPNWFVPFTASVNGLSAKEASLKSGSANSIWQIVNHLTFWNERYLMRFKELTLPEASISNDDTFNSDASVSEEEWQSAVSALKKVMTEWIIALEECTDEKMLSSAYKEPVEPWSSVIANLTIHNAYHIGQIVEIRKIYGLWDAKNGVH